MADWEWDASTGFVDDALDDWFGIEWFNKKKRPKPPPERSFEDLQGARNLNDRYISEANAAGEAVTSEGPFSRRTYRPETIQIYDPYYKHKVPVIDPETGEPKLDANGNPIMQDKVGGMVDKTIYHPTVTPNADTQAVMDTNRDVALTAGERLANPDNTAVQRVYDAGRYFLDPEQANYRDSFTQKRANQGIVGGSDAFDRQEDTLNKREVMQNNDLILRGLNYGLNEKQLDISQLGQGTSGFLNTGKTAFALPGSINNPLPHRDTLAADNSAADDRRYNYEANLNEYNETDTPQETLRDIITAGATLYGGGTPMPGTGTGAFNYVTNWFKNDEDKKKQNQYNTPNTGSRTF